MQAKIGGGWRWLWGQPYVLLSLTALFWSGNLVLGRAVALSLPPVTLATLRWVGAFLIVLPLAWPVLRDDLPAIKASLPLLTLLAATGVALNNALVYIGLHYTQATNALILQSASPLIIALWSYLLFRERLTGRQMLGLALSFSGVLTVLSQGAPATLLHLRLNPGDLFVIGALVSYALYSTVLSKRPRIHTLSFSVVTFGLGALMLMPFALGELAHGAVIRLDAMSLLAILYVVLFPSLIAFLCFNRGVELIGSNRAGAFFHLMPVFGAVLAMLFLGERPALYHGAGFLLILGGVGLVAAAQDQQHARRAEPTP